MPERGRSSDSGLPLPPPSRLAASGVVAGERLPLQRRDRPGFAPGSLTVLLFSGRAYHRAVPRPASKLWGLWLPVVAWAGLIFALSSVPDLGTGLGGWDLVLRKIAHAAEYGVLGALLARAAGSARLAVALGVLYAVSDEVHQSFVSGREGSPLDVAIDAVGVVCGIVLWQLLERSRSTA
jgi:VanZ like family